MERRPHEQDTGAGFGVCCLGHALYGTPRKSRIGSCGAEDARVQSRYSVDDYVIFNSQ